MTEHPTDVAIEHWPLDRLLPYAANARTHSDDQVAQIAGSIAAFGFNVPCLVDERGVLIAGHGRLLAARQLGLETVPVIRLEHLSEAQARAFRIADNRIAENAGWDDELLGAEFHWLHEEAEFDLDLTGFTLDEIAARLTAFDDGPAGNIDDDEAPEAPETPVTRPGDLWLLGGHRLLCGDATVLGDVERVLDGGLADLCFTDPPYNVDYGNSAKDRMRGKKRRIRNDNLGKDFERFLYDACVNILTVTKGAAYVCMSSSELPTLQCQWRSKKGPPRRCKKGPLGGCGLVPVVHGRAPRATRRALNRLTRRRAREGPVGPRGQAWPGWSVQLAVGV